ncbi:hypothetical protein I3843_03G019200 [Carya illinoinensis]|uniref:Uncharacterized protein n=1 Tax=Carya illinoinensis TaxID=32201 RepID=A0A8T1QZD4_CARIL|nr:hypothetical protein I3760_03G016100 [Carya illinoinensis]KAG6659281.1 hypothetical protein CIPAW_03G022700 [Carya illinoinensis]KAG6670923.1 hypothetical protein I3843_Q028000 [Carya illinoinensis]KAG6719659.1 hypothetical protein I3842_03G017400 [Carya illinoinensis]KAG7985312.1 hypothetical protein I3843_03G019200 [Carya illinoinensis]
MKTISLICCMLLAFLLFSSPSIMARELTGHDPEAEGGTSRTKNPNKPAISCGRHGNARCIGKPKTPIKCDPSSSKYTRGCKPPQGP